MGRMGLLGALAILAALTASSVGSAAQKTDCSNESSGWTEVTTAAAKDAFEEVVESYDRNGDGDVCLLVMWGEDLNPNSHWYLVGIEILGTPTEQYLVRDNNANGSS